MRRNAYAMLRPYRVRDMCAAHSDPWRWAAGRQHGPTTAWAGAGLNLKLISLRPAALSAQTGCYR